MTADSPVHLRRRLRLAFVVVAVAAAGGLIIANLPSTGQRAAGALDAATSALRLVTGPDVRCSAQESRTVTDDDVEWMFERGICRDGRRQIGDYDLTHKRFDGSSSEDVRIAVVDPSLDCTGTSVAKAGRSQAYAECQGDGSDPVSRVVIRDGEILAAQPTTG